MNAVGFIAALGLVALFARDVASSVNGWRASRTATTKTRSVASEFFAGSIVYAFIWLLGAYIAVVALGLERRSSQGARDLGFATFVTIGAISGFLILHALWRGRHDSAWIAYYEDWRTSPRKWPQVRRFRRSL